MSFDEYLTRMEKWIRRRYVERESCMQNIVDLLQIDMERLARGKRRIMIYGVGDGEQLFCLRLATRRIPLYGFLVSDEDDFYVGMTLLNKPVCTLSDITDDGHQYIVLQYSLYMDGNLRGGDIENINVEYINLAELSLPLIGECIVYGAGYQGRYVCQLAEACGVTVKCFCDGDRERLHKEYCGRSIISPEELSVDYADLPVVIGVDPLQVDAVIKVLKEGITEDKIYTGVDLIHSLPLGELNKLAASSKGKKVLYGNGKRLSMQAEVLRLVGIGISFVVDEEGKIDGEGAGVPIRTPFDLAYEDSGDVELLVERSSRSKFYATMASLGLYEFRTLITRIDTKHREYLDPNLGRNICYKGSPNVPILSTHNDGKHHVVGIVGGSTSDISLYDEISWPEQLVALAERRKAAVTLLCGGTAGYIVSQELTKFLRDMSFRPMNVLISYSGFNDLGEERKHNFVSKYQMMIFKELEKAEIAPQRYGIQIEPEVKLPLGIGDSIDNWLHYERMLYALCCELGITFYGILQPNLTVKKSLSREEKTYRFEYGDYWELVRERTRECQRRIRDMNVDWLVDFTDIFDEHSETVYFDICHLTSYGNEILASKILDKLQQE